MFKKSLGVILIAIMMVAGVMTAGLSSEFTASATTGVVSQSINMVGSGEANISNRDDVIDATEEDIKAGATEISTWSQLSGISSAGTYYLKNDITADEGWEPIDLPAGANINGDGYVVTLPLSKIADGSVGGLFNSVTNSYITKLGVKLTGSATITIKSLSQASFGFLANSVSENVEISQCWVNVDNDSFINIISKIDNDLFTASTVNIGGIVGKTDLGSSLKISDCLFQVSWKIRIYRYAAGNNVVVGGVVGCVNQSVDITCVAVLFDDLEERNGPFVIDGLITTCSNIIGMAWSYTDVSINGFVKQDRTMYLNGLTGNPYTALYEPSDVGGINVNVGNRKECAKKDFKADSLAGWPECFEIGNPLYRTWCSDSYQCSLVNDGYIIQSCFTEKVKNYEPPAKPQQYNITLKANGGSYNLEGLNSGTIKPTWSGAVSEDGYCPVIFGKFSEGTNMILPTPITKPSNDSIFRGYKDDAGGYVGTKIVVDSTMTLTAEWITPYTITLDYNLTAVRSLMGADAEITYNGYLSSVTSRALIVPIVKLSYTQNSDGTGGTINYTSIDSFALPTNSNITSDGLCLMGWKLVDEGKTILWNTESITGTAYKSGVKEESAGTATLQAVWEKIYTINLDANGGSVGATDNETLGTEIDQLYKGYAYLSGNTINYHKYCETFNLPGLVKDDFEGSWQIQKYVATIKFLNGGVAVTAQEGADVTGVQNGSTGDGTVKALWTGGKLIAHLDGGEKATITGKTNPSSSWRQDGNTYFTTLVPMGDGIQIRNFVTYDDTDGYYPFPDDYLVLTKKGYVWAGWYIDEDYATELTDQTFVDLANENNEVDIYAKWKANTLTAHFNPANISGNIVVQEDKWIVGDGNTATLAIDEGEAIYNYLYTDGSECNAFIVLSHQGYNFVGWYMDEECTTPVLNQTMPAINDNNEEHRNVYAKWEKKTYTIQVVPPEEGGSISPVGTGGKVTLEYGDSQSFTITINTGWVLDKVIDQTVGGSTGGKNDIGAKDSYTYAINNISANHILSVEIVKAVAIVTLDAVNCSDENNTITWSSLGGEWEKVEGSDTKTVSAKYIREFEYNTSTGTLPELSSDDYVFVGWFTSATGGSAYGKGGFTVTADVTLYAHWKGVPCNLTAVSDITATWTAGSSWEGSGNTRTKKVNYQDSFGQLPKLESNDFEHDGWQYADGTDVDESSVMKTKGATIYAKWTPKSGSIMADARVSAVSWTCPTGWTAGGQFATKAEAEQHEHITYRSDIYSAEGGGYCIVDSSGCWEITLDGNNVIYKTDENGERIKRVAAEVVEGIVESKSYTWSCGSLPGVDRTGYHFEGWYTSAIGGTKVETYTEFASSTINIYAHWTALSYTLTADGNGANDVSWVSASGWTVSGQQATKMVTFDQEYRTLPSVKREGYAFEGWYTSATDGDRVTSSTKMTTMGAKIYAHWEKVYTISIKTNFKSNEVGGVNLSRYPLATAGAKPNEVTGYPCIEVTSGEVQYKIYYVENRAQFSLFESPEHIGKRGYTLAGWQIESSGTGVDWTYGAGGYVTGVTTSSKGDGTVIAVWTENTYTIAYHNIMNGTFETTTHKYTEATNFTKGNEFVGEVATVAGTNQYVVSNGNKSYKLVGWTTSDDYWDKHSIDQPKYEWLDTGAIKGTYAGLGTTDYYYIFRSAWTFDISIIKGDAQFGKYFLYNGGVVTLLHNGNIDLYPVLSPIYTVQVYKNSNTTDQAMIYMNGSTVDAQYYTYQVDYLNTQAYKYQLPEAQAIKILGEKTPGNFNYNLGTSYNLYYELFWKYHIITNYSVCHNGNVYTYINGQGWKIATTKIIPGISLMGGYAETDEDSGDVSITLNSEMVYAFAPDYSKDTIIKIYPAWDYFSFNVNFRTDQRIADSYKHGYVDATETINVIGTGAVKYMQDYGIAVEAYGMSGLTLSGYSAINATYIEGYSFDYARAYIVTNNHPTSVVGNKFKIHKTGAENNNIWDYPTDKNDSNEYYYKSGRQYWIDIEGYYLPDLYRLNFEFNLPSTQSTIDQVLNKGDFDASLDARYSNLIYKYANCAVADGKIVYLKVDAYTSARRHLLKQNDIYYIYVLQDQEFRTLNNVLQTTYDHDKYGYNKVWLDIPTWSMNYYELQYYYIHNPRDLASASDVTFYLYPTANLEEYDKQLVEDKLGSMANNAESKAFEEPTKWCLNYCDGGGSNLDKVKTFNMYWYRRFINLDVESLLINSTSPNGYIMIEETEQIATKLIDHSPRRLILYMLNGDNSYATYYFDFSTASTPSIFNVGEMVGTGDGDGIVAIDANIRHNHETLLAYGWKQYEYTPIYIGNSFTITAFDQSKDNTLDDFIGYRFTSFTAGDSYESTRFAGIANIANYINNEHAIKYNLKIGEKPTDNDTDYNTNDTFVDKEIVTIKARFENIKYTLVYQVSDEAYQIQRYPNMENKFGMMLITGYRRDDEGNLQTVNRNLDATTISYLRVNDDMDSNIHLNLGAEFLSWRWQNYGGAYLELADTQDYYLLLNARVLRMHQYGFNVVAKEGGTGYGLNDTTLNIVHAVCKYMPFEIMVEVVNKSSNELVDKYILGREADDENYSAYPVFTVPEAIDNKIYLDSTYMLNMLTKKEGDPYLYYYNGESAYALLDLYLQTSTKHSISKLSRTYNYPITEVDNIQMIVTRDLLDSSIEYQNYIEVSAENRFLKFKVEVSPLLVINFVADTDEVDPKADERRIQLLGETIMLGEDGNALEVKNALYKGYKGQTINFKALASENYYTSAMMTVGQDNVTLPLKNLINYEIKDNCTITIKFVPRSYNFNAYIVYNDGEPVNIEDYATIVTADNVSILEQVSIQEKSVKKSGGPYYYGDLLEVIAKKNETLSSFEVNVYKSTSKLSALGNKYGMLFNGDKQDITLVIKVDPTPEEVVILQNFVEAGIVKTQINDGSITETSTVELIDGDKLTVYIQAKVGYKFSNKYDRKSQTIEVETSYEGDFIKFVLIDKFSSTKGDNGYYCLIFNEVPINIEFEYDVIDVEEIMPEAKYTSATTDAVAPWGKVSLTQELDPKGYRFDSYSYIQPKDTEGYKPLNADFIVDQEIIDYLSIDYNETIKTQDYIVLKVYVNYIRQYKITWSATPALANVVLTDDENKNLQTNRYYDRDTIVVAQVETTNLDHYQVSAIINMDGEELITTSTVKADETQVSDAHYTIVSQNLSGFTKQLTLKGDCHIALTVTADTYYSILKEDIKYAEDVTKGNSIQFAEGQTDYSVTTNIKYEVLGNHAYNTRMTIRIYLAKPGEDISGTNYYDLTGAKLNEESLTILKKADESQYNVDYQVYEITYVLINIDMAPTLTLSYSAYSQVKIDIKVSI